MYEAEVEAQVERNAGAGGWSRGPFAICREAREEAVDISAWLRGLDGYPMSAEQLARLDRITELARRAHAEILELEATYEESSRREARSQGRQAGDPAP